MNEREWEWHVQFGGCLWARGGRGMVLRKGLQLVLVTFQGLVLAFILLLSFVTWKHVKCFSHASKSTQGKCLTKTGGPFLPD